MGRTFSPKALTFKEARATAGLHLIKCDLEHVFACCSHLLSTGKMPNPVDHETRAFISSALIGYRRCFNGAVGTRLNRSQVVKLGENSLLHHDFVMALANKHIAHSINEFEQAGTTLHIAEETDGSLCRSGLGYQMIFTYDTSLEDVRKLRSLAASVRDQVVSPQIEKLKARSLEIVSSMTDDELRALPSGFPPHPSRMTVARKRTWPAS